MGAAWSRATPVIPGEHIGCSWLLAIAPALRDATSSPETSPSPALLWPFRRLFDAPGLHVYSCAAPGTAAPFFRRQTIVCSHSHSWLTQIGAAVYFPLTSLLGFNAVQHFSVLDFLLGTRTTKLNNSVEEELDRVSYIGRYQLY